jgi:hypothetical protein
MVSKQLAIQVNGTGTLDSIEVEPYNTAISRSRHPEA